jgi:HPt (histidine-containing phosphotransfer) domain-containing protein
MAEAVEQSGRIDLPALLDQFGGLREVLHEVIVAYLEQCPALLEQVTLAVMARDAGRLARSAHSLKGAVGIFGVRDAIEPAASLERAGKSGDLSMIDDLHARLAAEAERLRAELQRLLTSLD